MLNSLSYEITVRKSCLKGLIYLAELQKEMEIVHLPVCFPDGHTSQCWAWLQPGARSFCQLSKPEHLNHACAGSPANTWEMSVMKKIWVDFKTFCTKLIFINLFKICFFISYLWSTDSMCCAIKKWIRLVTWKK